MAQEKILFNLTGRDSFIDFIKFYSIICVVVSHCIPNYLYDWTLFRLWGSMQVPLFLLVQVFHALKREQLQTVDAKKIWKRIIAPFLFIQVFVWTGYLLAGVPIDEVLSMARKGGGIGLGSYYPWIYVQFAVFLPLLTPFVKGAGDRTSAIVFIAVAILFEIIFSVINLDDNVYRLLCVRYLFLIYLGYHWVSEGITMNSKTLVLSVLTLLVTLYFTLRSDNLEPVFFNTRWRTHRWICFYYVAYLLPFCLYRLFHKMQKSSYMGSLIKVISQSSYEIFLAQMVVFVWFPLYVKGLICKVVSSDALFTLVWIILTVLVSVAIGVVWHKLQSGCVPSCVGGKQEK